MSSSLLEIIRLDHEYSEKCQVMVGKVLDEKPNGQKAKVYQQHKVKSLVDKIVQTNEELERLYDDKDSTLSDEISSIRGANILPSFYLQLNSIREYYAKHTNLSLDPTGADNKANTDMTIIVDVPFSGEEVFGKYLDLHNLFLEYCNVIRSSVPNSSDDFDYLQYLDRFNSFFYVSAAVKVTKSYSKYLDNLYNYLYGFFIRVNPLTDFTAIQVECEKVFEEKVKNGEIVDIDSSEKNKNHIPQPLRLGMFATPSELEALGMDRLKDALEALGLKCGGTLQDRANRLWSVRGKKEEDFPPSLLSKTSKKKRKVDSMEIIESEKSANFRDKVIWKEFIISSLCDVMLDTVIATRKHAEKQQSRSMEEKEAEIFEEEFGLLPDIQESNVKDDDDEAPIYNPLNIPLGWDGKPIPYWLYKLHGLGVEYKCEVCGNQSYWGRRAFDKHFQEWKHAHGMRCLGVPNTKHFHDITLIEDVLALYNKIKDSLKSEQFFNEVDEEFEDTNGNVLNRRTYEDLARQGLL
eukprot:gene5409-7497_t